MTPSFPTRRSSDLTMLRIHLRRFAVPQAEEGRIKALNVRDIAAWRQLIAFRPVGRPIAHGVDALIQQAAKLLHAIGAGTTASDTHHGNQRCITVVVLSRLPGIAALARLGNMVGRRMSVRKSTRLNSSH